MADYVPLLIIGGLAVGGFILWKQGAFNNLFTPPVTAAPAPAPVSGSTSTSTSTSTGCMGTDVLTGQPCTCAQSSVAYAYPTVIIPGQPTPIIKGRGARKELIYPTLGTSALIGGGLGTSSTCDCTNCGGSSTSSILGGTSPSQFLTGTDLNNFVGNSIAQAGYRI